ncbi:MAG: 2,3,4,5-tetrahydropyridine-2-carboxylate N-succinyltransferase [Planctomycetota bacterium]|jgi:2,3,4,5-tetrahydropyridine-2-carboxylate N-succinyltransferase
MSLDGVQKELQGVELLDALESGEVRVAERVDGNWRVNDWVKRAILTLFRETAVVEQQAGAAWPFVDKESLTVRSFSLESKVRLVPGGSSVRRGAHIGDGCVLMPPMYVNIGAFVGAGSMVDSHALVGSCAQIGERVHLSAAAQIGGVLEPIGSRPVIIEDDALIGGGVGLYEGVLVRERAVLAAGVILTGSTPVFDIVNQRVLRGSSDAPLEIPSGAVVIPGTRPSTNEWAQTQGLNVSCAIITKYRDQKTDAATALEEALR